MPSIDLGRITPIPKGTWVSSTTYERLDIVNNYGNSYIAKQDVPINTSITTEEYWQPLLEMDKILVTPQMFGAKGDGSTDDTLAFQQLSGKAAFIPSGTYIVSHVEFGHGTILFGSGMGKTIIKQKPQTENDLFDFVDADCSTLTNMTLLGNKNEVYSNIYQALLKIRVTRTSPTNYSHYCNFEHLVIRNAPASGLVLLGRSSQDPNHPNSNHNWVHHFNDFRIEECNLWCMIDQTTDNLFSNFYLNEGDLGNLYCQSASNMYVNMKLDQPYGGGGSGSLEGFDDGALILLKNSGNNRFLNIDLQSAAYVGAKLYNCQGIHFDGDINNCGLKAEGEGIGLLIENSNHCTFNLEFHLVNTTTKHNVKINSGCSNISVFANEVNTTENPNACPETCFIVNPSNISSLYNSTINTTQKMNNLLINPLCQSLTGWTISNGNTVSIDTNEKTAGVNSFKIIGDPSKTICLSQTFNNLIPGDCYMSLAVVNIEQLSTEYISSGTDTVYTVIATNDVDSRIYSNHTYAPHELGKHLIAQVGKVSETGIIEPRFYVHKNNGIYYIGNFMFFNLTDLGIAIPAKWTTYTDLYTKLENIMDIPFDTVNITWDYTQIMGILKKMLGDINLLQS